MLPVKPGEGGNGAEHVSETAELMPSIKMVMDYGRLSFNEVLELPCDVFLLMKRHAYIDQLNETEEGRQYLRDCERLRQTEPDYEALRQMPGYRAEVLD